MAHSYKPVNREQSFLLPPNMADWLPEGHLAWFVVEVVNEIDTSELHKRHPNDGVGRRAYNPEMLLGLLIYAYCTKTRSSRDIERFCWSDVAYRVLCADTAPDHTTISRFRKDFKDLAKKLFVEVLRIAQEAGAPSVGVVALDGTKMTADASLKRNRNRESLEDEVSKMMDEADQTDAGEDEQFGERRGDELPKDLAKAATRKAVIDKAIKSLDEREAAPATPTQEREKEKLIKSSRQREYRSLQRLRKAKHKERTARKKNEARIQAGKPPIGRPRKDPGTHDQVKREESDFRANKARRKLFEQRPASQISDDPKANLTDPDSRVMQNAHGAWVQGYNAQSVADENGIVVAAFVTNAPNDVNQFVPALKHIAENLENAGITDAVGTVVADAGYISEDNLDAEGPARLIATGKAYKMKKEPLVEGPVPEGATTTERNEHLLRTADGRATYSKRQHMAESIFGHTKGNKGFRAFMMRGLDAAEAEWNLMMAAHNIEKLFSRRAQERQAG